MLRMISRTIVGDEANTDHDAARVRSDCKNTGIYCAVSLALFIIAGPMNTSMVVTTIPGGAITVLAIDIAIVVAVVLLCVWQMPGRRHR